jgi:hypothetical protein
VGRLRDAGSAKLRGDLALFIFAPCTPSMVILLWRACLRRTRRYDDDAHTIVPDGCAAA